MPLIVTSAGGVVYRDGPDGPLILMIADRQGRWSFPKGMVNSGEEPPEAARREVRETGVEGEVLSLLGETHYFFRQGGQLVSKKVYFLPDPRRLAGHHPTALRGGRCALVSGGGGPAPQRLPRQYRAAPQGHPGHRGRAGGPIDLT